MPLGERGQRLPEAQLVELQVTPVEAARERLPSLADAERAHIVRVLESVQWNKKQAANVLEISRGTLYRKIVEYGLEGESRSSRNRTRRPE